MKKCYLTLCCLLSLISVQVVAQILSPAPLTDIVPVFPGLHDREALVELEFTINAGGQAEGFQVVGGFFEQRFIDATINAVSNAAFSPATDNGEPVDWPGYRVTARFVIEDLFNTIQPGFSTDIRQVEELITAQDYDAAEALAQDVLNNRARYFFEFAYINLRLSEISLLQGRLFEAARASTWATLSYLPGEQANYGIESAKLMDSFNVLSVNQFSASDVFNEIDVRTTLVINNTQSVPEQTRRPPHLRSGLRFSNQGSDLGDKPTMDILNARLMQDALQAAIQIHARLGHIQAMKNDFARLAAVNPRTPEFLSNINGLVDQTLAQGAPLQSLHRIASGEAVFFPSRRTLTVANVEGTLSSIGFQCEQRTPRLEFLAGSEWRIPASWGECAVRFRGAEGTTFAVIEFE